MRRHPGRLPGGPTRIALRRATAGLLAALLALTALTASPAEAQSVNDKQAEAAQVTSQLAELEQSLSALDEEYNQARLHLRKLEGDLAEAEARVDAANAQLDATREQLRAMAVQAYIASGDAATLDALMGGEASGIGERTTYVEVATGFRRDLLDQLAATRQRTETEIADLEQVRAEAEATQATADAARDQADAAVREQDALQARVQGELAELVAAEEARRAEEQRRAAEAAAAQLASQQQAQASTTTTAVRATDSSDDDSDAPLVPTTAAPTPSTPAPSPAPAPSGNVGAVISAATSQVGTPYVWAGASPSQGFDCSGFTMWAWSHGGRSLPHSAAAQMGMTRRISLDQLQPGDLVFYGVPVVHHVALYIGGGTIVHAPGRGRFVRYDSVHYWSELVGAGRL